MKQNIEELAIFNGKSTFDEPLFVGRPNIPDREKLLMRINDCLDRRWLTNKGQYVQELEKSIAEYCNVKHCVATGNGTLALEILIKALELKGEVIVPSFTFIATAHALGWLGIKPVFCDIDPGTHTIDPDHVKYLINPTTSALIGVHLWGRPCEIDSLSKIADEHNLKWIFDAAHAFGCSYREQMIGSFGNAEVFSFHATKFFNTFEGGAITTNDDALAQKIRLMVNFGFKGYDSVLCLGINGKMHEVSAAMGLGLMEKLNEIIEDNKEKYQRYRKALSLINGLNVLSFDDQEKNNFQFVVIEIDETKTGIQRDLMVHVLHEENILARRYFYPGCHRQEPYCSLPESLTAHLKETEKVSDRVICLPTGSSVSLDDIDHICELLKFMIQNGSQITERLMEAVK